MIRVHGGRHDRGRRVCAHAAGVRALIAVAQPLVVLRGRERQHVLAIDHHNEARLLSLQAFLDDHARARLSQSVLGEHGVDRGVCLRWRGGDDDAFARGEPVGLDDDRSTLRVDVGVRRRGIGERAIGGGRNAVPRHERLREILRALQLRRGARRTEDLQPLRAKGVDDPGGERRFGSDDGQRHRLALRKPHQLGNRRDGDVRDSVFARRSGIARRDEHFGDPRRLGDLPRQRVLAPAAADDEPFTSGRSCRRCRGRCRD
jgi:hypothetical protein